MQHFDIRPAGAGDVHKVHSALSALSRDLGDPFLASVDDLIRHGLGQENAALRAMLAERTDGSVAGAALFSPVFSTVRGGAGLYVSDLWVDLDTRGSGLGPRLLAAACKSVPATWSVTFLRLAVYERNPDARRFYDRLGFEHDPEDVFLSLSGEPLQKLMGRE